MKKAFLALIIALLPLSVSADLTFIDDTSQFQFAPISLNPANPYIGDSVRVTVTVYNTSETEQQGLIDVFAGIGGEQIGSNLPVVVPPRGVDSVTMSWRPEVKGYYNINASLEATVGNVSVNKFNMMVYVDGADDPVVNNSDNSENYDTNSQNADSSDNSDNSNNSDNSSSDSSNQDSSSTSAPNLAPTTGATVEFTIGDTILNDGDIVVWNFSDGQSYTGNTIKRAFEKSGEYTVTRLVIASDGSSTSEVSTFRIAENDIAYFGNFFWFWIFLLLLLILAGVIIYTNKQSQKSKKSKRK